MSEVPAGSQKKILKVAVLGSGPSGFFAAEELLTQPHLKVQVDMFDRLPTPFGLVRGGVAPDHPKIKSVTKIYEKTASREGYRFFGHVEYGKDLKMEEIKKHYHAAIFAIGAKSDRKMNIPGEDFEGSLPATDFVGWYNGHPDYQDLSFDLSCEKAVVVGNGNVAIDVTRILGQDPAELEQTDITDNALQVLKRSKVKEVLMIGRRGPVQAAFTNPEIRELGHLAGADLVIATEEIELDDLSKADLESGSGGTKSKNNVQILKEHSQMPAGKKHKKIRLRFLVSPVEVYGKNGRVVGVKLEKNRLVRAKNGALQSQGTGQFEDLEAGLILRSIGYKGVPLPDLPYEDRKGTIPNERGRAMDPETKKTLPGIYVVGWAKRGPSGVIGTNKPDSIETVKNLLEDFDAGRMSDPSSDIDGILDFLKSKKVHYVTFNDWKKIDRIEIERGKSKGKPRKKFPTISDMLSALDQTQNKKSS